jgi:hypothetical protein
MTAVRDTIVVQVAGRRRTTPRKLPDRRWQIAHRLLLRTPEHREAALNSVAVEFDFMKPLGSERCLGFEGRKLRLDEARHIWRLWDAARSETLRTLGRHFLNATE